MLKLRINPLVATDLKEIRDYIAEDNAEYAAKTIKEIYGKFENIQMFPGIGADLSKRVSFRTNYKYAVWENYVIIYKAEEEYVEIDLQEKQQNNQQQQSTQIMSIPEFMDKDSGYVTGNTQQGYIINLKADTRKGRKYMEKIMAKAAETSVGGAVSVNMNIRNISSKGITDKDIEKYINQHL